MIRRSLEFSLRREGYAVCPCPDGNGAWEAFLADPGWDLVLTDMEMPGLNGLELARNIRARNPMLPILILTGHDVKDLDSHGDIPPRCQVLAKPYRMETLLLRIESGLNGLF